MTDDEHTRPDGTDDLTVEALGNISEALEAIEIARGHLYTFHRLSGTADFTLGKGVEQLREAGHTELANEYYWASENAEWYADELYDALGDVLRCSGVRTLKGIADVHQWPHVGRLRRRRDGPVMAGHAQAGLDPAHFRPAAPGRPRRGRPLLRAADHPSGGPRRRTARARRRVGGW